jgi:ADP-ribose pyrophosphatase
MPVNRWKKLNQKTVFRNDHWSYNLDEFQIENSDYLGQYHYVHTLGSTMVIPITDRGTFLLVNQYRYLNQKEGFEFPCGSIEKSLTAEENALKELREETGFSAGKLISSGQFAPYTGASDEICHVFIASNIFHDPLQSDITEEFELIEKSFDEIEKMISDNIIWDGLTICAWTISKKLFPAYLL